MAGGAIRNLLVNVGVKADSTKDLMTIQDGIDGISESFDRLKAMAIKGAAMLGVATAGIYKLTRAISADADQIVNSANMLGMAVEAYQGYQMGLKGVGLTAEQVDQTFMKLGNTLEKAKSGAKEAIEPFKALGISVKDIENLQPDQLFDLVAQRMRNVESTTKRLQLATQLYGDDLARKLLPILTKGGEEVEVFAKIAQDAGSIMTDGQAKSAARMDKNFRRLAAVLDALKKRLGLQLLPIVDSYVQKIWEWYKANKDLLKQKVDKYAKKIGDAIKLAEFHFKNFMKIMERFGGVEKVVANTVKLFAALTAIKVGFWLNSLAAGFVAFLGGLTAASGGTLLLAAALAATVAIGALLVEDFLVYQAGGESFIGNMEKVFKDSNEFDVFFNAIEGLERLIELFKEGRTWVGDMIKALEPLFIGLLPDLIGLIATGGVAALGALALALGGVAAAVLVVAATTGLFIKFLIWLGEVIGESIGFVVVWFGKMYDASAKLFKVWADSPLGQEFKRIGSIIIDYFVGPLMKAHALMRKLGKRMTPTITMPGQAAATPLGSAAAAASSSPGQGLMQSAAQRQAGAAAGGGGTQTINVEQTFAINGAQDPNAVGNEVARKQKQGTADAFRQAGSQFNTGPL